MKANQNRKGIESFEWTRPSDLARAAPLVDHHMRKFHGQKLAATLRP
jgi:hypothetical protein